jgi:uncharacterized phage protein (TIGR02218 family)
MAGRTIPAPLASDLAKGATTICYLLKVMPVREGVQIFGITTLDQDFVYDDGSGPLTYRAKTGYTAFDVATSADMNVDNSEAESLMATYPTDGMTIEGINRGDYDSARFVQYVVNYLTPDHGHGIINGGQVGQVLQVDDLTCKMEMRSLIQILKQNNIIESTSITCRAAFGDERCKMPLRWYASAVETVGAENDRTFNCTTIPGTSTPAGGSTGTVTGVPFGTGDGSTKTFQLLDTAGEPVTSGFTVSHIKVDGGIASGASVSGTGLVTFTTAPVSGGALTWDGTLVLFPDGFFVPGVVRWVTGGNAGQETEVDEYDSASGLVTLAIPTNTPITVGDTFEIRRDCDYSKAMCKDTYNNLLNMRAETELPRADGGDLMSPSSAAPSA